MPFTGSVFVSTNFAVFVAETVKTVAPFGLRREIFMEAIVEPVMFRDTRWLAVPVNVAVAVAPEFEIVTVTGGPPGVIEKETAAALPETTPTRTARTAAQKSRVEVRRPTDSQGRPPNALRPSP